MFMDSSSSIHSSGVVAGFKTFEDILSKLEQIKNEALVKLYSIQKIIDGRTFTAFLRKIYGANRKDTATKIRDQIFDISSVYDSFIN